MRLRAALLAAALLGACERAPPPPRGAPPAASAPAPKPEVVTLLYTTDEHGWLLPTVENGSVRGGAAEALGQWIAREGHCPGTLPPAAGGSAQDAGSPACPNPGTLLLSGGDNWTGPAVSSYYGGEPMARAMARMGYAAAAFGNHEFDFGREQFLRNRGVGGFPYVAANVRVTDPALHAMALPGHVVFERRGVKIGVVGLATDTTLTSATASRFVGIEFEAEEPALARAVPEAWSDGVDAVVLIAHECPDKLEPIVARHPDWKLAFVGGGHCHKTMTKHAGGAPIVAPGWRLRSYARVLMTIDRARPARERVVAVEPTVVELEHVEGAVAAPPDGPAARLAEESRQRTERDLGEVIGFTATGIPQGSAELGRWVAGAWRAELGVDVAIVNDGGLRQAVPRGPITKNTVYSVMPFDNQLLVVSLSGRDLQSDLVTKEAMAAGMRASGGGWVDDQGRPLDPERRYSVATIDFLYFGGSNFAFQKQDPAPKVTGLDWRAPVIEWTKKQGSTAASPLERRLR